MRYGDYVVVISLTLNLLSCLGYAIEGYWLYVMYFTGAALINGSLVLMWYFK
jgi:hypothetical protein